MKKFQKMWETANAWTYDIYTGSILPIKDEVPKIASFSDKNCFYFFEKGRGAFYYEEGEMEMAKSHGFKDFLNEGFQEQYFRGVVDAIAPLKDFVYMMSKTDAKSLETDRIGELLKDSFKKIVSLFGYYVLSNPQNVSGLEEHIQKVLVKAVPESQVREIFLTLATPTDLSTIMLERLDWLEIIKFHNKNPDKISELNSRIDEHFFKYHLLPYGDGGNPWTRDYFDHKFLEDKKLELDIVEKEINSILEFGPKTRGHKASVIKEHKISEEIANICELLARLAHLRLEMRVSGFMPAFYYKEVVLLNELADRLNYPREKIRFATPDEIFGLLEGRKFDKDILEDREEAFLVHLNEGEINLYSSERARDQFKRLTSIDDYSQKTEVKGSVAMKGKVTGKVVVFLWGDDINEKLKLFGDSTILVAGQTRPQLMPLINKSKAIVTDEGGITSHAAIVSRELKIPCIIGTKIATKVFRDGDEIEVDANSGMVRLISRAK